MAPMYGLCVDQQGSLFAVDNGNNRIQKFDNAGNFIILWGCFGSANANFHNPTGIACDGKGDVWVVDTNNHRVQKFDGKLGGYLMKFGSRMDVFVPLGVELVATAGDRTVAGETVIARWPSHEPVSPR